MAGESQLSYSVTPLRWYQRRRVQRWLMLVAVGAVVFGLYRLLRPMGERYRYYRTEQAITATWAPVGVAVRFSATQPYAHTPGAMEIRDANFWAARRNLLSGFTIGGPHTEIFSGILRTATGRRRLVQVYASPGTTQGVALVAVTMELRDWHWVVHGNGPTWPPMNDVSFGSLGITPTRFQSAVVFGGKLNPGDPSEVDVKIILNGKTLDIPLHVVDLAGKDLPRRPRPDGYVAIAAPLSKVISESNVADGGASWGFYAWPYVGAP